MKKLRLLSVTILILLFAVAPVHAQIDVVPDQFDFGEVDVGDSDSQNFTIMNSWWGNLAIASIELLPGGGGDFNLVNSPAPGTIVAPGSLIYFGIDFSPTSEGLHTAEIVIRWTNGESGTATVELSGTAVAAQPPPSTIQGIINFFDTSVANGSLVGAGPGKSAENRLNALRNMLIRASYLLSAGNYEAACGQLGAAFKRCNDFVQGEAQIDLIQMISSLMNDLGC